MKVWIGKFLDYLFVVLGAFAFLQFPLFIHEYQHQLIGHVDELRWQINTLNLAALRSEKTVDQYIQKFLDHEDQDFSTQGKTLKLVSSRWNRLSNALQHLQQASSLTRPFIFFRYFQWDIFKSTLNSFVPGFSFTFESLGYAFFGMLIGYGFFRLLTILTGKIGKKRLV